MTQLASSSPSSSTENACAAATNAAPGVVGTHPAPGAVLLLGIAALAAWAVVVVIIANIVTVCHHGATPVSTADARLQMRCLAAPSK